MRGVKIFIVLITAVLLIIASGCAARKTVTPDTPADDDGMGMVEDFEEIPDEEGLPFMEDEAIPEPDGMMAEPEPLPEPEAMDEPPPLIEPEPRPAGMKYIVVKDDTLWDISRKDKIYSNSFRWPLIFKANMDQIQDPDIIEIGQRLDIRKDWDRAEINDAVKKAQDTPPYVPHTNPRKRLPLKY